MKKIWLLILLGVVFIIPKGVEAKEYSFAELVNEYDFNTSFELEVGDIIGGFSSEYNIYNLYNIYLYYDDKRIFSYNQNDYAESYTIPSLEDIYDIDITDFQTQKVMILFDTTSGSVNINISYILEDDIEKQVIYHNTYDAENSNPLSYYVSEADILLSDIEREGYKFLGWYTSPTFEEDTRVTMISADEPEVLELYARWEKIEDSEEIIDSSDDNDNDNNNIFTNPETSSSAYVVIGILMVTILSTVLIIVYRIRKAGE